MKIIKNESLTEALSKCTRPSISVDQISPVIDGIFDEVKANGDDALRKYTHFFDQVDLDEIQLSSAEIKNAKNLVAVNLKKAIEQAKSNIEKFHKSQSISKKTIETSPGVVCWQESRPIEKIGLYIPGGSAPLFSTVLMLAIPAKLAGCKEVVLCTPPRKDGTIDPIILYVAELTGLSQVFRVGGAQAIAAMTYGTKTIPEVYKIFGPGNQYVTAAKMKAQQYGVAIDMPAGPSELLVLADDSCDPAFVASDLLSQAEHGSDSQVICIANTETLLKAIQAEIKSQLVDLPRKSIAEAALCYARFIVSPAEEFSIDFINAYAPEHLILATLNYAEVASKITNAGSVFLGNYTPESAGDYASGTNHTLPTSGYAKTYSGVNLDSFVKKITFQEISESGILGLGESIELMAEAEQLQAHKNAVTIRLKKLRP